MLKFTNQKSEVQMLSILAFNVAFWIHVDPAAPPRSRRTGPSSAAAAAG